MLEKIFQEKFVLGEWFSTFIPFHWINIKLGDFIPISLILYSWFLSFAGFKSVIFSYKDGF